jgi:Flp pilus assembly protein TadD
MFRTAIRIDPKSIDAHESLAAALEQKGDGTAARRHRAQADRLKALTAQ